MSNSTALKYVLPLSLSFSTTLTPFRRDQANMFPTASKTLNGKELKMGESGLVWEHGAPPYLPASYLDLSPYFLPQNSYDSCCNGLHSNEPVLSPAKPKL
ncbi:hypothetical protein K435DRAFT_853515 [Dendrothele bispora CBS 962.96]|uniref:Uncharacterized protein n=1 Tax=Dendrothele bispora (strain CBS 962.96) TaxID=1314807 RepID=A0A4V4HH74_DENBC|nr:hypothetical protein K435DRAFT_853515 [Dendrothele bispora CBS 962.96]